MWESDRTRDDLLRRRSIVRTAWCDPALPADISNELMHGVADRVLFSAVPLQLKDRCVAARLDHPGGSLLIKRHTWGGWLRTLRMGWREAPSRKSARLADILSSSGILTPRPRACVEYRLGPYAYCSYLLTDFVEGTSLYRFIRFGEHSAEVLEGLAQQVAAIWEQLIKLGLSHCDMKPENFIVDPDYRVWLIDLERAREGERAARQRRYQIADVTNFLHIRGWHHRPRARQIFADAILRTAAAKSLQPEIGVAIEKSTASQQDCRLAVLVLGDSDCTDAYLGQLCESVRDIADEVLLAAPARSGLNVLKRISLCGAPADKKQRLAVSAMPSIGKDDWILNLYQGEWVTPVLSRKLQDEIAMRDALDAYSITITERLFDNGFAAGRRTEHSDIRLFRQSACEFSVRDGRLVVSPRPKRAGELVGQIQKALFANVDELAEWLNETTARSARLRLEAGQRPRWLRAAAHAARHVLRQIVTANVLRDGWPGLHAALLEAAFICGEEAKLAQLVSKFPSGEPSLADETAQAEMAAVTLRLHSNSSQAPAAKAA